MASNTDLCARIAALDPQWYKNLPGVAVRALGRHEGEDLRQGGAALGKHHANGGAVGQRALQRLLPGWLCNRDDFPVLTHARRA